MKYRSGFVSNSSSTSFCIYGTCFCDQEIYKKIAEKIGFKYDNNEGIDLYELGDAICKKFGLTYSTGPGGDYLYIGRDLSSMKDDETFGAFKKKIEEDLTELLGEEIKCSIMEEGWFDG